MSRRLVLDASAAVRAVLGLDRAGEVLSALEAADLVLAPTLLCSETASALWKYVRAGALDGEEAAARYETVLGLVDTLVPDSELAVEALGEAIRHGHSVYDLCYAVLARRHGCTLLTLDRRLGAIAERLEISHLSP